MKKLLTLAVGLSVASLALTGCSSTKMAQVNKKHYTVTRTYAQQEADLAPVAEGPTNPNRTMSGSPSWGEGIMAAY